MKFYQTLIISAFFIQFVYSQEKTASLIVNDSLLYEKVYLHIDRELYSPREIIWFRVYIVSGFDNRPIQGLKNVYVELIDSNGNIADHRLILTHNGSGFGEFIIPYYIDEGLYTIRAYTKYQKNFNEKSFFHKIISIATIDRNKKGPKDHNEIRFNIGFFPESGTLVRNAINTVAVKATDESGYGIELEGYIVSDQRDTIVSFRTTYLGMCSFNFVPIEGRTYKAFIKEYPTYSYQFENILDSGIAMHVLERNDSIELILSRNFKLINYDTVIISATHKGIELFKQGILLQPITTSITLPKSKFPLGISKLSVENLEGRIEAERIYFIQNGFESYLNIEAGKKEYQNRELVNVSLSTQLPEDDSLCGGVSMAVINSNYLLRNGYNMDCRSYLLLDSELKSPIESSASYFIDDTIPSSFKLNLLTMVQGWRSYYWNDILNTEEVNKENWEDIGLVISGWLKHENKPEAISNGKVTIGPFSSRLVMLDTVTDLNGRFRFDRLYLRDSTNLILQALDHKGKPKLVIHTDQTYMPNKKIDISKVEPLLLDFELPANFFSTSYIKLYAEYKYDEGANEVWTEKAEELLDQYYSAVMGTHLIGEVQIKEDYKLKLTDLFKSKYDLEYGNPDTVILTRNIEANYLDVYDYFNSNPIKGLQVKGKSFTIRNGKEPIYLLNDLKTNSSRIGEIKFSGIDKIFLTTRSVVNAPQGVIAIDTYAPPQPAALFEEKRNRGKKTIAINGFQVPQAFYSPKYTIENINQDIPDYRPTLFWEPFLFFNDGRADVDFFTSDNISECFIIVEGISKNGRICSGIASFNVK